VSESKDKTDAQIVKEVTRVFNSALKEHLSDLERRIVNVERGLEAVLRRIEESKGPDDDPGWYGGPE
jgi:hypothetical protein